MAAKQFLKRNVSLDAGRFVLRTLTREDATERWAQWMGEYKNLRLLNAAPTAMTRKQVADYIGQFDQRGHILLGIFEKAGGALIGFFRVDLDPNMSRCLVFIMIGEQKFRHWTTTHAIRTPFHRFVFETLQIETALATVLASNIAMVRYMQKSGWEIDKTAAQHVPSRTSGDKLDLCLMRLTRERWQAWLAKHPQG